MPHATTAGDIGSLKTKHFKIEWVLHKEKDHVVELLDQGDSSSAGPFLE
jgi:hypothetical protein